MGSAVLRSVLAGISIMGFQATPILTPSRLFLLRKVHPHAFPW
jgi:hypothetical protein